MNAKINIAIIEDDRFYANLLAWNLGKNEEYRIKVFHSASKFLEYSKEKYDLMVLDFHLGNKQMNGLELAKNVKNVPKIFISGENDISQALTLIKEGEAVDYISKGFSALNKIVESVDDLVLQLKTKRQMALLKSQNRKRKTRLASVIGGSISVLLASFLYK